MRLVLHPEQVAEVLELAAELGLDPETVAQEMFGAGTDRSLVLLPSR